MSDVEQGVPVIQTSGLTHMYGDHAALSDVELRVPAGSLYALLGPNGSGKTTLLQILMGLRRATRGHVTVFGKDVTRLTVQDRALMTYVAEGQRLPEWMTLQQLEAYLAPLYSAWDHALADDLRERFQLRSKGKVGTFSRGEKMKAALLVALAPRPRLLIMDEPFSGIDVATRDALIHGVLESAGTDGWTVVVCSHDIAEIELLADWVGFLQRGKLNISEPMDNLRGRFQRVEVFDAENDFAQPFPNDWLDIEQAGQRVSFITQDGDRAREEFAFQGLFSPTALVDVRPATLREVFVALTNRRNGTTKPVETAR
jgi:ABC-type multidrug transport system ATPase subunit